MNKRYTRSTNSNGSGTSDAQEAHIQKCALFLRNNSATTYFMKVEHVFTFGGTTRSSTKGFLQWTCFHFTHIDKILKELLHV